MPLRLEGPARALRGVPAPCPVTLRPATGNLAHDDQPASSPGMTQTRVTAGSPAAHDAPDTASAAVPDGPPGGHRGGPAELGRVVPPSGNMEALDKQFWPGYATRRDGGHVLEPAAGPWRSHRLAWPAVFRCQQASAGSAWPDRAAGTVS